jgi:DNA replication protein DnaC
MRTPPTLETLQARRLTGMSHALCEHMARPESVALSCAERLGLLGDREGTERRPRRLTTRLRQATLRQSAGLEAGASRPPRGRDTALLARLATCPWVQEHRTLWLTGPTGVGNTWLAGACGHPACRDGCTTRSLRLPRLLQALPLRTGAGRSPPLLTTWAKTERLILDDWGLAALSAENRRDLVALLADWHDRRAPRVTSQLPVAHWHEALGDPTVSYCLLL